jgi:hypothetical protein
VRGTCWFFWSILRMQLVPKIGCERFERNDFFRQSGAGVGEDGVSATGLVEASPP